MQSVIHLISGDESEQETALAIAKNIREDENSDIEDVAVVAQSKGIEPLTSGGASEDEVQSLMDQGVSFKACANTLEMMDMDESDLIDGVEPVPEGAVEVTRLESEGYAYLRP